jgi:hypothetical protein
MSNRQIHQLTAETAPTTSFVVPVQIGDGTVEAKKTTISDLSTAMSIPLKATKIKSLSDKTASYTLTNNDSDTVFVFDSVADSALNIPLSTLSVGFTCTVIQKGTGDVTFTPAGGVTMNHPSSHTKTSARYAVAYLHCIASNVFILSGSTRV